MNNMLIIFVLSLVHITSFQTTADSASEPTQDSDELRLQDMLINMLTPYIERDLRTYYYPKVVKDFSPGVLHGKLQPIRPFQNHDFHTFEYD